MDNKEEIIKKIEKLLSLAGNNPNENEAVAAALKAQKLMAKYHVEMTDVHGKGTDQEITEKIFVQKSGKGQMSKWKYFLATIVSNNFCCKCYCIERRYISFFGYEKDAAIAREVFKYLYETGNRLAHRYYYQCRKEGKQTKGVMNTYLMGFCEGIKRVLDRQCTALKLVTPKEVQEAYMELSAGFKTVNNVLSVAKDRNAYSKGIQEGRETVEARQLEG